MRRESVAFAKASVDSCTFLRRSAAERLLLLLLLPVDMAECFDIVG